MAKASEEPRRAGILGGSGGSKMRKQAPFGIFHNLLPGTPELQGLQVSVSPYV